MSRILSAYADDSAIITNRQVLESYRVPESMGSRHHPISFFDYANEVEEQLQRVSLKVISEEHIIGHDGNRHFGIMEVAPALEGDLIQAKDWSLFLGLRGSHDRSVSRGLALGRRVMVCSNLCFSGDIATISTKQTTNIWYRLPSMLYNAVAKVPELAYLEEQRVEELKNYEMKPTWGDAALVEIMRRNGLSSAQLGRAVNEWDNPSHEEFTENGHTAWRLEQAVTEAVKPSNVEHHNLFTVHNRTRIASDFINEIVGFNSSI